MVCCLQYLEQRDLKCFLAVCLLVTLGSWEHEVTEGVWRRRVGVCVRETRRAWEYSSKWQSCGAVHLPGGVWGG